MSSMSATRMPPGRGICLGLLAGLLAAADPPPRGLLGADGPEVEAVATAYAEEARPLILRYCSRCHSRERTEADVDLGAFETLLDVRKRPRTWQKVEEMLSTAQMPPEGTRPLPDAERARLLDWVRRYLAIEARARAGDPGPVTLRRLSNAEYTYTVRDLTGIESLDPARELPADGAAGEGFTNTGNALVMSPSLLDKYLDRAKGIAAHAVLLPDRIRFSTGTTPRDWTDQALAEIKRFHARFVDADGRVPLEKYLEALLAVREGLSTGEMSIEALARGRSLNARYLETVWKALSSREPSLVLDAVRARWRAAAPSDAPALAALIAGLQKALWRFQNVGHMKSWMEPARPIAAREEIRLKVPAAPGGEAVTIHLAALDAGDGDEGDFVLWERPRLVAPGRQGMPLRDVRAVAAELSGKRARWFARTARCLEAAEEAAAAGGDVDAGDLARRHGVEPEGLEAWLSYLGIRSSGGLELKGHFTTTITNGSGHDFIRGWGSSETPSLVANSSDRHVRIPGNMPPRSVAVHPSPALQACAGWRSPVTAAVTVAATVTHAHPECGNGVAWSLELRRGATRQRLAAGTAQGPRPVTAGPIERLAVLRGDLISLLVGPRDGNHACDLTNIDIAITAAGGPAWGLAADVSGDVLAGNPHADGHGNEGVWHFYAEAAGGAKAGPVIPAGSLLARWQAVESATEKRDLAVEIERLLVDPPPDGEESPDALLRRQLWSLGGPLFAEARGGDRIAGTPAGGLPPGDHAPGAAPADWGLDPAAFGRHPLGSEIDPESLCVKAPSVIEVRLPADLVAGCELLTAGRLEPSAGAEGSVQIQALLSRPDPGGALRPDLPIVVNEGSTARRRVEAAMDAFRDAFPAAMCYTRIVPVDEAVTLTLFHREDGHLARLMLDDAERSRLDRLWEELHYVSHDALALVDAFAQLMEYATQDGDPRLFEPFRKPIHDRADAFRRLLAETEPRHLEAVIDFAARAYRRPLAGGEADELRALYRKLKAEELPHDEAIRLTLARVLVAPAFLYRLETPGPGAGSSPVSGWELATRLGYFLWSSCPDERLLAAARDGRLGDPDVLVAEARRLMDDARVRRLALEFACQWLGIRDFAELDEKSERHFPAFAALRGAMLEEAVRFFTDLFRRDGSVLEILDADHAFLDEALARHYGIPGVAGPEWRRVDGVKRHSRGGVLTFAATLAKQSGASRTSPILRGNWLTEVLLGEKLPKPPKGVPELPPDEAETEGLTVRQLVERHTSDPKCLGCHRRIDPYGYALEAFDAIGRLREKDLGDRPIDTRVETMDGARFEGLEGLRRHLLTDRRDAFVRQFCRKLLGYALGRATQLSDEPLLDEMARALEARDYRVRAAVETMVRSRPFREIRGRDAPAED
jgi:hypothetical protein